MTALIELIISRIHRDSNVDLLHRNNFNFFFKFSILINYKTRADLCHPQQKPPELIKLEQQK